MEYNYEYDLTKDEYNECLMKAEIAIFLDTHPNKEPMAIFVVAQPGAGKTALKNFVINEAQDLEKINSYIEFNPDEIALYHKYYEQIIEKYPENSYKILQKFVKPALDGYLRFRAIELRNNIIQEGTFASEQYVSIIDFLKNGGKAPIGKIKNEGKREDRQIQGKYNIEIDVLAVDSFESLLSSYEREQYFIESNLLARIVTPENHDFSYNKMLNTLRNVEQKCLADTIKVYKRGEKINRPELVYTSGDKQYASAVEAIIETRRENRSKIMNNSDQYIMRINKLRERIQNNNPNNKEQIERLNKLEKDFVKELMFYKQEKSL